MNITRRGFLKMLGIGLGAAAIAAAKAELPPILSELVDGPLDEEMTLDTETVSAILKQYYLRPDVIENMMIDYGDVYRQFGIDPGGGES